MPRLKAEQRREQLISTAISVFAKGGYDGTTTAEIAKAAKVTEPILYRHFKNKQELFVAIVREVSASTVAHLNEVAQKEKDPAERLRKLCAAIPEHIKRLAEAYQVLYGALTTCREKKVVEVLKEHYSNMHAVFRDAIRSAQSAGVFRKDMSPKGAAWHVVMSGVGYAMLSLNLGVIDRATINETIEEFMRGMKK